MNNDYKDSDARLQEKLSGFRMTAPEGAWAGIESQVGARSGKRRGFFFWSLLLFVLGGVGAWIIAFTFDPISTSGNFNTANLKQPFEQLENSINAQKESANNSTTAAIDQASRLNNREIGVNSETLASTGTENDTLKTTHNTTNYTRARKVGRTKNAGNSNNARSSSGNSFEIDRGSRFEGNSLVNAGILGNSDVSLTHIGGIHNSDSNAKGNTTNATLDTILLPNTSGNDINKGAPIAFIKTTSVTENGESPQKRSKLLFEELPTLALRGFPSVPDNYSFLDTSSFKDFEKQKVKGQWSLEAGLDLSSFRYSGAGSVPSENDFFTNSYSRNLASGGFLRFNYQPLKYLSINSGIGFSEERATQAYSTFTTTTTFQYDSIGVIFDSATQVTTVLYDTTEISNTTQNTDTFNNSISQIQIPIGVTFHFPFGNSSELGINVSGLVGIRTKATGNILLDDQGTILPTQDAFRSVNFSAQVALRYTHFLGTNYAVFAEPYFGLGLNNRSTSLPPIETRFRNSGIRAGFRYTF